MFWSRKLSVLVSTALLCAAPGGAQEEDLRQYFDIRLSDEKAAVRALEARLARKGVNAASLADESQLMANALADLGARYPSLDLTHSVEVGAPEIVGMRGFARLTGPSKAPTEEIARSFVEANSWVYGLSPAQAAALELDADYTNPAGNISWVRLKQRIHGLPLFRGELTFALTQDREIFRTMGQLATALPSQLPLPDPKLSAAEAIGAAAFVLDIEAEADDLVIKEESNDGSKVVFERGPFARETTIELVYFPLGPGAVELAWSMTIWPGNDAYYALVSAEDGLLLFNKNIVDYQTQSATYNVYRNGNAFIDVADSPAPLTPGPNDPSLGTQGALLTRENVTLIGNEGPLSFNNNGWITDGGDRTDGNNVQAGLDIVAPDGVDPNGEAIEVTANGRDFVFAYTPASGNPAVGDDPTGAAYRNGAVTQLFYITNRYHDVLYQLGFTEAAFNFQDVNFSGQGAGGDRVSAEAQDSSGTNNANFSTPPDGTRGRMQMFRWTLDTPNRDGDLDADIVIHELTHGTSNRLHGNATGLGTNMSRGMGEGWSDFYAHALLSEPSDPVNGTYTTGGYSTFKLLGPPLDDANYYYGIRRFPKAPLSFTGGAMNRPHNPVTFADIDQLQVDYTDGAFPAPASGHLSNTADQVHTAGEVWSSALWEVRTLMVNRLGWQAGTQRALQVVTDGMKLAPVNPTFIQERDAIIAAAAALPFNLSADMADVREGFRLRGMGFSATVDVAGQSGSTRVTEAFDFLNVKIAPPITVASVSCSDAGRGAAPGEAVAISVPVENTTGSTINNVVATLDGTSSVFYGSIADGATDTKEIYYTIPATAACGTGLSLDVAVSSDAGVQPAETIQVAVGEAPTKTTTFENTASIDLPAGAPGTTSGPAGTYPSIITVSGVTDPVVGATITLNDLNHTWVDDLDMLLVGPGGDNLVALSDRFGNTDAVPTTVTLDDNAAAAAPDAGPLADGTYRPANTGAGDSFDAPAPAGPHNDPESAGTETFASIFGGLTGSDVNGDWELWIDDDAGVDSGTLSGGWALGIVTAETPVCLTCTTPFCVPVLDVSDQIVDTTLSIDACQALTSSDVSVLTNGDLTFSAGDSIKIDEFSVDAAAKFKASN